jgi:hypothetical protein
VEGEKGEVGSEASEEFFERASSDGEVGKEAESAPFGLAESWKNAFEGFRGSRRGEGGGRGGVDEIEGGGDAGEVLLRFVDGRGIVDEIVADAAPGVAARRATSVLPPPRKGSEKKRTERADPTSIVHRTPY